MKAIVKTLAICIPTYKRPELLRRCIFSALQSAQDRPIKIFVADDSVSDVNDAVRSELMQLNSCVNWHMNPVNLGIDRNIQNSIEISDCDYAWLSGEDDFFFPGAVARVYDLIQTIEAPFVFANYAYVGEDPTQRIATALPTEMPSNLPSKEFIPNHLWAVGFIGACVVNRKIWSNTDPAPYADSYFTHVGRISELIASQSSVPIVADCCVANRVEGEENFTWRKDSYGVFFGFLKMCQVVGQRLPDIAPSMELAANAFERRYKWLSIRLAMRLRSQGAFDYSQFVKYLRPLPLGRMKLAVLEIVSVTPRIVFHPLVLIYRMFRNVRNRRSTMKSS